MREIEMEIEMEKERVRLLSRSDFPPIWIEIKKIGNNNVECISERPLNHTETQIVHDVISDSVEMPNIRYSVRPKNPLSIQIGGDHYKKMKIQPVEFITANDIGFLEGNVIKYVCRHEFKNGVDDINKAIHYLELLKSQKYEN